jgi:hypothetical protein
MTDPEPFLALVRWTDAHHVLDYEEMIDEFPVQTVGWVIGANKRFLAVAQEQMPEDAQAEWRGVTFIPHGDVDEVIKLAEFDDSPEFPPDAAT